MKYIFIVFCLLSNLAFGQSKFHKDFNEFWTVIHNHYAYLSKQNIDWKRVHDIYLPVADTIQTPVQFVSFLEKVLNELYNGHSSLNTNLPSSNRLIPSGSDMFVERINNKYIITDLRKDFGAELSGLKNGMEIILFNGNEIDGQLQQFLPKHTNAHNIEMYQYAISMLFAGTHAVQRQITALENGKQIDYFPDKIKPKVNRAIIEHERMNSTTGYIKINNSLGDNNLIPAFDAALDSLFTTKKLILDLTETPGGGNTTVARAMMGRFIEKKSAYQQHEFDEAPYDIKRSWTEYVLPRNKTYKGRLIVLVGHWTGSMGEGLAIGFDGMKRGTVIGTKMAGLIGAINGFTLTETKIGYQFPTERLYHIDGTPREDYIPGILTSNIDETRSTVKRRFKIK